MYKNNTEKETYEAPIVTKQQVVLEQIIAAGSTRKASEGMVQHEWEDEVEDHYDYEF
ncbi:hypothetical protein [Phocaeicola sp.]